MGRRRPNHHLHAARCRGGKRASRIVGSLEGLAVSARVEASFTELDGELIGLVWT
jgi:hypothetical protein